MCTKSQLIKISEQMTKCYREIFGDKIVKIIIYGSNARGDFNSDFDIDLAAIVNVDCLELQNKLKKGWDYFVE